MKIFVVTQEKVDNCSRVRGIFNDRVNAEKLAKPGDTVEAFDLLPAAFKVITGSKVYNRPGAVTFDGERVEAEGGSPAEVQKADEDAGIRFPDRQGR